MDAIADATKVKRLTHRETLLIVLGMLLPIFMGSLDQTSQARALPTIGRDLGNAHELPWLITAYRRRTPPCPRSRALRGQPEIGCLVPEPVGRSHWVRSSL